MHKLTLIFGFGVLTMASITFAQEGKGRGQQALENLDTNGDGVVDFSEFQENAPDVIAQLDSNGDNEISLDEFLDGRPSGQRRGGFGNRSADLSDEELAEIQEMMLERATESFNAMDLDGNGLVSSIEMHEANFLRMDDDNDGVLSASELRRRGPGGRRGGGGRHGGPGQGSGAQSADS